MRYFKIRISESPRAVKKYVQIQRARIPSRRRAPTPEFFFYALEYIKQRKRRDVRLKHRDGIVIIALFHSGERARFVNPRDFQDLHRKPARDFVERPSEIGCAVADVGAERDINPELFLYHLIFDIRSSASAILGSGTVSAKRTYPSPEGPRPLPGVATMAASSRSLAATSLEL